MGGHDLIKSYVEKTWPQQSNKPINFEALRSALNLSLDENDKVYIVMDVGVLNYKVCRLSPFSFSSFEYFIYAAMRIFRRIVMPFLNEFSGAELILCFDGCRNDLKEHFKEMRLLEDEITRRRFLTQRVQAANHILTRLINLVAASFFSQSRATVPNAFQGATIFCYRIPDPAVVRFK